MYCVFLHLTGTGKYFSQLNTISAHIKENITKCLFQNIIVLIVRSIKIGNEVRSGGDTFQKWYADMLAHEWLR